MTRRNLKFWDFIAKRYSKQPITDEDDYRHKLDKTRELFSEHSEVLELGCGTGTTALSHAPYVKHLLAVDVSAKMLAIADEKKHSQGVENVTSRQCTVEELSVEWRYDVVMAHSILHLLEDRDEALAKVFTLLKPGGYFVSSTVCIGGSAGWMRAMLSAGRFIGLLPLVRFFTPEQLCQSIERAGMVIEYQWQPGPGKALFVIARKPV